MTSLEPEVRRALALRAIDSALLRLSWLAAATRFEIALRRHDRALKLAYKYGYNPAQPRDDRGRWTDTGGGQERVRLAGKVPTSNPPEIPKERPPRSPDRTAAYKAAARWLTKYGGTIGKLIEAFEWLREHSPLIEAYRDPPRSLEALQNDVSNSALGYDIHHIVRRDQTDIFGQEAVNSPENLVRIPRLKHWEINGWYQEPNPDYDWETPKDYVNGRNWDVQRAVGLDALRIHGVLKP